MVNINKHSPSSPQHIFLMGHEGVGKSTVGRLVARQLGLKLGDVGLSSMRHKRMRVSHIISVYNIEGYLNIMEEALQKETQSVKSKVIVIYLSTILKSSSRRLLQNNGTVFYMRASVKTLQERKLLRERKKTVAKRLWRLCKILSSKTYTILLKSIWGNKLKPEVNPAIREKWNEWKQGNDTLFEQCADHIVDTNNLTPEQIAMEIVKQVKDKSR